MALRTIRLDEDPILRKVSKEVKEITPRLNIIIKDMIETMHHANGIGLAAVQIGILKRVFIADIQNGEGHRVFINPEIIEVDGTEIMAEGCLSLPERTGDVERPSKIKIKAMNEEGKEFTLVADELLARAIQHENDHLNGILFTDYIN